MSVKTVSGVLAAAVVTGGTFSGSYPAGTTRGDFVLGARHRLSVMGGLFSAPESFTISLGATTWTVTYQGATTIPAGSKFTLELDRNGVDGSRTVNQSVPDRYLTQGLDTFCIPARLLMISLGTPTTLSTTAICAAQAIAGAVDAVINGTKAVSGAAPLGAPTGRAVQVVSSNAGDTTQTITIRGTDMYGQKMSQTIALNGTTPVLATKAFGTVTRVSSSAALAGNLSVGDTDKLGLPVWLGNAVYVLKETQDGASATAGTFVAGLGQTLATAANGDVRGTYTPNAATDGSKSCVLFAAIPEPDFFGQAQFYA